MKCIVGICVFALLVIGMSVIALNITSAEAAAKTIYVDDDNTGGPWDGTKEHPYQNITNGLEQASDNDTIYVYNGTYYEHLTINKSIVIRGENETTTILDGENQNRTIVNVVSHYVTICGFTVRNTSSHEPPAGISVRSSWNTIQDNIFRETFCAIDLGGNHTRILNNRMDNNYFYGVLIRRKSEHNAIINNWITNNPTDVYLVGSQNTIRDNVIGHSDHGIFLESCIRSKIQNNKIFNNSNGISIYEASNNTFVGNTVVNNSDTGVYCYDYISQYNKFYHNNFINNRNHKNFIFINCSWDNGVEGNYWSDYKGIDLDERDGIGDDAPHHGDNYPLMGVFHSFNTSLNKFVNVVSNSTIEDFQYFKDNSTIKMFVSNMTLSQTYGFCRVTVPHTLMNVTNIEVIIDNGTTPLFYHDYTLDDNGTHRWIYFSYQHSKRKIEIIPEFPLATIMLSFTAATTVAVTYFRKKREEDSKFRSRLE